MKTQIYFIVLLLSVIHSDTHLVPDHFPGIQSAINASAFSGDTIIVSPGTYVENIDFTGKSIFLTSHYIFTEHDSSIQQTIIDGNQSGSVVTIINGEDREAVLTGFTIVNGSGRINSHSSYGGGIFVRDSSPRIENCIIKNNYATEHGFGGGLLLDNSSSYLSNLQISENYSDKKGGGIFLFNSNVEMDSINRCSIFLNQAAEHTDIYHSFNSELEPIIYLDTATVEYLDDYFIGGNFESIDILNGRIDGVPGDLYVSSDGDNNNSGLSPDEPLKTIVQALNMIDADSMNPGIIHLLPGIYSPSSGQIFPLNLRSDVSLIGSGVDQTILDLESSVYLLMAGFNYEKNITLSSMSIVNGSITHEPYTNTLIRFIQNTNLIIENITFKDNDTIIIDTASLHEPYHFPGSTGFLMRNCNFINNKFTIWAGALVNIDIVNSNFYWDHPVDSTGGGIAISGHSYYFEPEYTRRVEKCRFTKNVSTISGTPGGVAALSVHNVKYPVEVVNCTFADNISTNGESILIDNYINSYYGFTSDVLLINCILWNPGSADEIVFYEVFQNPDRSQLVLANSDIRNGYNNIQVYGSIDLIWEESNIDAAPLFADPETNDYSLQAGSPCIDAGTAFYVFEGDTILNLSPDQYHGSAPDMGAYEFISQINCNPGDMNQDGIIDILDVVRIVFILTESYVPNNDELCAADVNEDGVINILDVIITVEIILASN